MSVLLNYVFPITVITPIPAASTAFLKQVCLVCKPKTGQEGNVGELYECTTMTQVAARTDNENAQRLFDYGMQRVFILLSDDLDLAAYLEEHGNEFYTVLISDDFDDEDLGLEASLVVDDLTFTAVEKGAAGNSISIALLDTVSAGSEVASVVGTAISVAMEGGVSTAQQIADAIEASAAASALVSVAIATGQAASAQAAASLDNLEGGIDVIDVGGFTGVVGVHSNDLDILEEQAAIENRVAFYGSISNGADSMAAAFGRLLSNLSNWRNQQYVSMPLNDGIDTEAEANSLFDDRISFVLNDTQFGNRLAFFAAGGAAIIAPYIIKNLRVDMQSTALTWISTNQPDYTIAEASILESALQGVVDSYIERGWLTGGTVEVSLVQQNFVANADIDVPQPKALWKVIGELTQQI